MVKSNYRKSLSTDLSKTDYYNHTRGLLLKYFSDISIKNPLSDVKIKLIEDSLFHCLMFRWNLKKPIYKTTSIKFLFHGNRFRIFKSTEEMLNATYIRIETVFETAGIGSDNCFHQHLNNLGFELAEPPVYSKKSVYCAMIYEVSFCDAVEYLI